MSETRQTHARTFVGHYRRSLKAGEEQTVFASGGFLLVTGAIAPFKVGFDDGAKVPTTVGFKFRFEPGDYFQRITLQSDVDNVVEFYAGAGDVEDARMNVVEEKFFAAGLTVQSVKSLPTENYDGPTMPVTTGQMTMAPGGHLTLKGKGSPKKGLGRRAELRIFNLSAGADSLLVYPYSDNAKVWQKIAPGGTFTVRSDGDFILALPGGAAGSVNYIASELFYPYDLTNPFAPLPDDPARMVWLEDFALFAEGAAYAPSATPDYNKATIAGAFNTTTKAAVGIGGWTEHAIRFPKHSENTGTGNNSRQRIYAYLTSAFFDEVGIRPTRCRFTWDVYCPAGGFSTKEWGGDNTLITWCDLKVTLTGADGSPPTGLALARGLTTLGTTAVSFTALTWYRFQWDVTLANPGDAALKITKPMEGDTAVATLEAHGVDLGNNNTTCPLDGQPGSAFVCTPSGLLNDAEDVTKFPFLGTIKVELF